MKKKMFFCVAVLSSILFITGCSNQSNYSDFKHYKLEEIKDTEPIISSYFDDTNKNNTYLVAQAVNEGIDIYLYYKVNDNDYILLEKSSSAYDKKYSTKFNKNKLYLISDEFVEYTLDKEKIKKKNLEFNKDGVAVMPSSILSVDEENIDIYGYIDFDITKLRCSLKDYKCSSN